MFADGFPEYFIASGLAMWHWLDVLTFFVMLYAFNKIQQFQSGTAQGATDREFRGLT
jgi:hypothetical protein